MRDRLLEIAAQGVRHAAELLPAPVIDPRREIGLLLRPGASFVTLKRAGTLRGCIGSLKPTRPLAEDVAENAYAAARRDPRFPRLEVWELAGLQLSVATLGPHETLLIDTRDALLAALRPGIDGLVVRSGALRATFLPAVWEQLPEPADFVDALWHKARLTPGTWPEQLQLSRYHVETVHTRL
ncbi:MAG: AmmeMemoRadiSam system protein A [Thioalkalivibrio sp.]|nr:MAG: AmmeMemoRadiSam system protein A [Thioalkalivibrio sp.]